MTRTDAIITICKEFQREPTRRSWLAMSKAFTALDVTEAERHELETRLGFRTNNGDLYPEIATKPVRRTVKKYDWTNVR